MFDCECVRCGTGFTSQLPTVICFGGCRAALAAKAEEYWLEYLATPGAIWPGDAVRYRDPRQVPGAPRSDDVR